MVDKTSDIWPLYSRQVPYRLSPVCFHPPLRKPIVQRKNFFFGGGVALYFHRSFPVAGFVEAQITSPS